MPQKPPLTGSCLCGVVRYEIGEPLVSARTATATVANAAPAGLGSSGSQLARKPAFIDSVEA